MYQYKYVTVAYVAIPSNSTDRISPLCKGPSLFSPFVKGGLRGIFHLTIPAAVPEKVPVPMVPAAAPWKLRPVVVELV